ncbi:hypothetical protein ACQUJT_24825 [Ralstonia pseudosolanacearum]
MSQPAGAGCGPATSKRTFDGDGNKISEDDFNGHRTCFTYDTARRLQITRTEGLSGGASCGGVPAGGRRISTAWHPDWQLPTKIAEPGRITTYVYNGQTDPFGSGALSCAPTNATVVLNGNPIAVVCKIVEQITDDKDGSAGFGATQKSGTKLRVQQWTYNKTGQVLTAEDPLGNVTTYTYYANGDLQTIKNAKGQITRFTLYTAGGLPKEVVDPNGNKTTYTYDVRSRMATSSANGLTTTFDYDGVGNLMKVTRPDTSWISFEYNSAYRLTAVRDGSGNRIEYTLDAAGNRTGQSVKDPNGKLTAALAFSIDALGRVQRVTGQ